jgi:hypothetical protein
MSTLTITIGIVAPIITFLIGRYFRSKSKKQIQNIEKARDYWRTQSNHYCNLNEIQKELSEALEIDNEELTTQNEALLAQISNTATVQIVPNINPHHAADKEYIGVYPNNGLEPAHLTREEYQKGVDRLKDNPEDNILTKPVK